MHGSHTRRVNATLVQVKAARRIIAGLFGVDRSAHRRVVRQRRT